MVRAIDLLKVSRLNDLEYAPLFQFAELMKNNISEEDIPEDVHTLAFLAMRKSGANVKFWNDMVIAAYQLRSQRRTIERLRKIKGT